jgi:hypothetical protein
MKSGNLSTIGVREAAPKPSYLSSKSQSGLSKAAAPALRHERRDLWERARQRLQPGALTMIVRALLAAVEGHDLEGIVAKRKSDPYRRGVKWWKVLNRASAEEDRRPRVRRLRKRNNARTTESPCPRDATERFPRLASQARKSAGFNAPRSARQGWPPICPERKSKYRRVCGRRR